MSDDNLERKVISQLDENGFEGLFGYLLNQDDVFRNAQKLKDVRGCIYERSAERFIQSTDVLFLSYYIHSIYKNFDFGKLDLDNVKKSVLSYLRKENNNIWLPIDGITLYFVSNLDSQLLGISDDYLLEYYEKEINAILPNGSFQIGIGNINTFLDLPEIKTKGIRQFLNSFLDFYDDGIAISISADKTDVYSILHEREFSGLLTSTKNILSPVIKRVEKNNGIIKEFNQLINTNVKESVLEEFLQQNYQLIFGERYDRISTQLWLKFPELDIGEKDRRIDIFMRNSISEDWELYELKRADIQLTKTRKDIPMFISTVNDAMAQVRNYKRILMQDNVRRKFEQDGIEYYEPEINIVIGKKPNLLPKQWRQLVTSENDLKIITYDDLLREAKERMNYISNLII